MQRGKDKSELLASISEHSQIPMPLFERIEGTKHNSHPSSTKPYYVSTESLASAFRFSKTTQISGRTATGARERGPPASSSGGKWAREEKPFYYGISLLKYFRVGEWDTADIKGHGRRYTLLGVPSFERF